MESGKPISDMMEDSEIIEAKERLIIYEEVDSNCEAEDTQEYSTILLPERHDDQGLRLGLCLENETEDDEEFELTSCSISTTSSKEVTIQCMKHSKEMPNNKLEGCSKEILLESLRFSQRGRQRERHNLFLCFPSKKLTAKIFHKRLTGQFMR